MKKEVWVIDDDGIYQMVIKKMILRSGVFGKHILFGSPLQALEQLECPQIEFPDIILLDINMPQMDGWQFLEAVRDSNPELLNEAEIYIVSSSIAYSDRERMKRFPEVRAFITKPVSIKKLKEIGTAAHKKSPVEQPDS